MIDRSLASNLSVSLLLSLQDVKRGIWRYRHRHRSTITVRRMHHYRTITITVSDHTLTRAIQPEIVGESRQVPRDVAEMHSMSKIGLTWSHVASVSRDRALSSLLFALKAKINCARHRCFRVVLTVACLCARTCMRVHACLCVRVPRTSYVDSPHRTPHEMDRFALPRATHLPACKITFSPPSRDSILPHSAATSSSFRYYIAAINPRWAYRPVSSADCFIRIISIENNRIACECRRLAMDFYGAREILSPSFLFFSSRLSSVFFSLFFFFLCKKVSANKLSCVELWGACERPSLRLYSETTFLFSVINDSIREKVCFERLRDEFLVPMLPSCNIDPVIAVVSNIAIKF